jgi:hypothetical protein
VVVNGGASFIEVESKVEELNSMKARLANLQSLVAAINRGEMPFVCRQKVTISGRLICFNFRSRLARHWQLMKLSQGGITLGHLPQSLKTICAALTQPPRP